MKKLQLFWMLIFTLLVVRFFYFYAQPDLSTDNLSQMAITQNFMEGKGFSFKYMNDQAEVYYKTHIQWPPLYPFVLALISYITINTLLSSYILQTVVILLLVLVWRKIFNLFGSLISEDAYFYFIALLIISTSILNNINTILVFALLLISVSIYFIFAYLLSYKFKKLNLLIASFFASLLFWTHYSYFFVTYFPAIVLFLIYFIRKEKNYLITGIISFVISVVITCGVLIYNYANTGYVNYMDNPHIWDAGFFPEHLLLTDPFFLNAFFKTSYYLDYLLSTNNQVLFGLLFQLISFLIFLSIIVLYLKLRRHKSELFKEKSILFIPFLIITTLTIAFLLYFTLHYHEIPRPNWTHIGDPRYLSAVYMSVLAVVIMLIFINEKYISNKIKNVIKVILLILILSNLVINIYITFDHWGKYSYDADTYVSPDNDLQTLFDNITSELKSGNIPVFIDNNLTVRSARIGQYAGAAVINSRDVLNIEKFPEKVIFFVILPDAENFRNEDIQLLEWSKLFYSRKVGRVYDHLNLYKVNNIRCL